MPGLLDGLNVVDLGQGHSAPYCAKLFADAGANVIHVEPPTGDASRSEGPFAPRDQGHEFSASFAFLNSGKSSVTLDMTTAAGAALLWELIDRADILVENSAPGTLEKLGFGMDTLLRRRPGLVRISITGFGQTGPYHDFPATEMTLQAAAGLMDGNGVLGREPLRYPMNMAHHWAGANAAYAGLVAYWHSMLTGEGQLVDVSVQESLANTWYMVYADYQYTGALQARGQRDLLPAADGQVMIRWQTSVPWEQFAIALDALELVTEPDLQPPGSMTVNAGKLFNVMAEHTASRPRREWMDIAIENEIPAGMVQSLDDIAACEQHAARGFWDTVATPWESEAVFPGVYYVVNGEARSAVHRRVPRLGEHNQEILGGLLGRSPGQLNALRAEGVI
ncbi:MAG: CoA transferase [Dehalococcoidia bacterium]|nr:CoA transferase [Dehalococcoidia bacterium]MCB9484491.1 CoA transferase [Thermoflexaceae bacterium]